MVDARRRGWQLSRRSPKEARGRVSRKSCPHLRRRCGLQPPQQQHEQQPQAERVGPREKKKTRPACTLRRPQLSAAPRDGEVHEIWQQEAGKALKRIAVDLSKPRRAVCGAICSLCSLLNERRAPGRPGTSLASRISLALAAGPRERAQLATALRGDSPGRGSMMVRRTSLHSLCLLSEMASIRGRSPRRRSGAVRCRPGERRMRRVTLGSTAGAGAAANGTSRRAAARFHAEASALSSAPPAPFSLHPRSLSSLRPATAPLRPGSAVLRELGAVVSSSAHRAPSARA
jgi:hypothetical protein